MDVKQEILKRGRQNAARFRSDQGEKRGERLFNNRGLLQKRPPVRIDNSDGLPVELMDFSVEGDDPSDPEAKEPQPVAEDRTD